MVETAATIRLKAGDQHFLQLLAYSPFLRRPAGGWSFGTTRIGDVIVERLIQSRRAASDGQRVWLMK